MVMTGRKIKRQKLYLVMNSVKLFIHSSSVSTFFWSGLQWIHIPGTLGTVCAPFCIFTLVHTYGQSSVANPHTCTFLDGG